ncbi:hypothetical protein HYS96_02385 [Candidatus Daviesbacteria bacterium]|nr:hypothetical protein [Candidatus Daviesbacteria bacterium]
MTSKVSVIILITICFFFTLSWYKHGLIIGGAEEGLIFLDPHKTQDLYKYTWEDIHYGGPQTVTVTRYPNFVFLGYLKDLGVPSALIQIFTFLTLILTSAIFTYLFAKEILGNKQMYCLLAALFYIGNTFVFFNIWHRFLLAMFFFEPLLPASIYFLYKVFKTNNILYLLSFLLISFILSSAFSLPSNVITLWVVLFFLLLSNLIEIRKSSISLLKYVGWFVLFLLSWVLTNLWWIIPLNYQATVVYSPVFGTNENIAVLRSISNQFPFLTAITLGYKSMLSMLQGIISFVMLLVVWLGFKETKSKDTRNFLLIIVLVSYFVLNGSNFPTGKIFEFFFEKISQLQLLRNPYEKFGIVLTFAYSLLFPLGILYLSKISRYISIFLVILIFGFLFIPVWGGKVFGDDNINFYVSVPADYKKVNELLNQDTDEFRILQLPLLVSGGLAYNWPNKYFGIPPNSFLFDKPSLEGLVSMKNPDNYWRALREGFYTGKIRQLLKYANIRYLVLHKDIDTDYSQSEDTETTLFYLNHGIIPDSLSSFRICHDLTELTYIFRKVQFFGECKLDSLNSDWSNINFLSFEMQSDGAGQIRVDIVDRDGQRLVFEGKSENIYTLSENEVNKTKLFTLNIKVPTEKYAKFSPINVDHLELTFIPSSVNLIPKVRIGSIYLDKGTTIANDYWSKIYSTANLEIYRINDSYFYPRIYAVGSLLEVDNWNSLLKLNSLPDAFYLRDQQDKDINYDTNLDKPDIEFKKINNTRYEIYIKNAKTPFWLVFSETFSPDWKAKLRNGQEFAHFTVNGFTNGYFINQTGDFTLELEYIVQQGIEKYRAISLLAFIAIVIIATLKKRAF